MRKRLGEAVPEGGWDDGLEELRRVAQRTGQARCKRVDAIPLRTFGDKDRPKQFILTLKGGRKNTGWIPGEYIKGSTYLETGLGLHL